MKKKYTIALCAFYVLYILSRAIAFVPGLSWYWVLIIPSLLFLYVRLFEKTSDYKTQNNYFVVSGILFYPVWLL